MNKLKMENELLIRKIARSFSTSTGLEFDDLFQEASLAYLEALKTYDPDKGRITTHLWRVIQNHLKNYLKEEESEKCKKYNSELISIEKTQIDISIYSSPYWENLNKEAQEIANIILSTPKTYIGLPPNEVQIKIVQILLNKGWNWLKIYTGMKNLQTIYA